MSTTAIWKRHENYLRHVFYWENTFWTDGYFVSSVGNVSQETIKKYNANKKTKKPKAQNTRFCCLWL